MKLDVLLTQESPTLSWMSPDSKSAVGGAYRHSPVQQVLFLLLALIMVLVVLILVGACELWCCFSLGCTGTLMAVSTSWRRHRTTT